MFICYFFRDPDRVVPDVEGAVVSPADGKVIKIESVEKNPFKEGPCLKISVFMSVFNVHVNRIPHDGCIRGVKYNPGKYFAANLDKASKDNEQNALLLETESGKEICFVQISVVVATWNICLINEGDVMARGQRFGMICFGSRLDVYLPKDATPAVYVGDKVKAGASILGHIV